MMSGRTLVQYHTFKPYEAKPSSRAYYQVNAAESTSPYQPGTIIGPLASHGLTNETDIHPPGTTSDFEEFVRSRIYGWEDPDGLDDALLEAGTFYPRMWRGPAEGFPDHSAPWDAGLADVATRSLERLECLYEDLLQVFRVVAPSDANSKTYGARIRGVLLAACTEVEAQLRGILSAHDRDAQSQRLNMTDYVRLASPLKLAEYSVVLNRYPDFPAIRPFASWSADSPSQSIPWYDAYNKTKHDVDAHFAAATLAFAINAVAAVESLVIAQWGPSHTRNTRRSGPFQLKALPLWHPTEMYYGPLPEIAWRALKHPL